MCLTACVGCQLEEELLRCRGDYEALHMQLLAELPTLNRCAAAVLGNALKAFITARTALQGRLARSYMALKQVWTHYSTPG